MAATERKMGLAAPLAAAVLLPLAMAPSHADTPPERAVIAFKYLDYADRQPGIDRISVTAPSLLLSVPVGEDWSFAATHTVDTVSGASPRYHSEPMSMTRMHDVRRGTEARATRYLPNGSVTAGVAVSKESDYDSKNVFVQANLSSESRNTTWHGGLSFTRDLINPTNGVVVNERKSVTDAMVGVTQVLTPQDIVQLNLTRGSGKGYYSDPYKFFDNRPRAKTQDIVSLRWNHHVAATDGTSRLGYRHYRDSFGIRSRTVTGEYVQPLKHGWTVTPMVRLYSQTAARFYVDPVNAPDPTIPDGFVPGETLLSLDQRLAAFGGRSVGVKVAKWVTPDLLVDLKYENYQQRSDWVFNGKGSPGIAPFSARIFQVGLSYYF